MGHTHTWHDVEGNHIARAVGAELARGYDGDFARQGPLDTYECSCGAAMVAITSEAGDRLRAIREAPTTPWRELPTVRGGIVARPEEHGGDVLFQEGEPDFESIGTVADDAERQGLSVGGPPPHQHRWEGASLETPTREAVHSRLMTVGKIGSSSDMSVSRCIDCKQQMAEVTDLPTGKRIRALRAHPYALWHIAEGEIDHEVQGEPLFEQPPADGPEGPACNWRPHDWQPAHLGDVQKAVGQKLNFGADSYRGEVCMDCGAQRVIADAVGTELVATREQNDYCWRGTSGLALWREGAEEPDEVKAELPPPPRFRKGQAVTNGKVGYSGEVVEVVLRVGDLWHYQVMPDSKRHPVGADEAELQPRHRHDWRVGADISDEIHDRVVKTLEREIDVDPDSTVFSCGCGAVLIVAGTAQDTRQAIRTAEGAAWCWAKGQGSDVQPSVPLWPDLPPREGVGVSGFGHVGKTAAEIAADVAAEHGVHLTAKGRERIAEKTGFGEEYSGAKPPGGDFRSWKVGPAEWRPPEDGEPRRIVTDLYPQGMEGGYAMPNRFGHLIEADAQIVIEPNMDGDDPEEEPRDRFTVTPDNLATVLAVLTATTPGEKGERGGYHLEPHRRLLREALEELLRMTPDAVAQHLRLHAQEVGPDDELEASKLIWDEGDPEIPAVRRIWTQLRRSQPNITLWEVACALVVGGNLRPGRVAELEDRLEEVVRARVRDVDEVKAVNERAEAIKQASTENTLVAKHLLEIVEPLVEATRECIAEGHLTDPVQRRAEAAVDTWDKVMAVVDPTKE